jgi:hypothetical protein
MRFPIAVALAMLGATMGLAQLRENCSVYLELIDAGEAQPRDFFLAACCFANNELRDEAFTYLNLAVDNGYHNAQELVGERFLDRLHSDPRWQNLVARTNALNEQLRAQINGTVFDLYRETVEAFSAGEVPTEVRERHKQRLARVAEEAKAGRLKMGDDYFHAAFIFRYSTTPEELEKGRVFITRAARLGALQPNLRRIDCELEDLYLWSIGKPQVWGTQKRREGDTWSYEPFDQGARDDGLRVYNGIQSLEDIQREIRELKQRGKQ